MGWFLPVVSMEIGECIDGRDEAVPPPLFRVTLGAFDCIRKTLVMGFKEDLLTAGRQVPFVGLRS